MRILLAERRELFRDGVRAHLSELASSILETVSLDEALFMAAKEGGVDIALLGSLETSGEAAIKRLKDSFPRTHAILITADNTQAKLLAAIAAGAVAVLPRSVSGRELLDAVRVVMWGGLYLPANNAGILARLAGGAGNLLGERLPEIVWPRFSPGEAKVLPLLMEGMPNKLIALRLEIEDTAVKARLRSVFRKLGVTNRSQAIKILIGGDWHSAGIS